MGREGDLSGSVARRRSVTYQQHSPKIVPAEMIAIVEVLPIAFRQAGGAEPNICTLLDTQSGFAEQAHGGVHSQDTWKFPIIIIIMSSCIVRIGRFSDGDIDLIERQPDGFQVTIERAP
jgi:hypothetical protein